MEEKYSVTEPEFFSDPLTEAAEKHFDIKYLFPYQRLVISNILQAAGYFGKETPEETPYGQIVILPTGAGKSLCFTLPSCMLDKPTLVIFPLLSLISDQARRLSGSGIQTGVIRGGQNKIERDKIWRGIKDGTIKIILSNPESILNPDVLKKLKSLNIIHLVIDETHTVSEWGETFRPVYLEVGRIAREAEIPIITAFTATASAAILEKVKKIVFPDFSPNIITANPDRPNIFYKVIPSLSKDYNLVRLLKQNNLNGNSDRKTACRPALVFCRSRTGTEMTARMLRKRLTSNNIYFYHAGLTKEEKRKTEEWFFNSAAGILVATCAYGMGVDKTNIRTVIHRDLSPSVESYLQESGRAGRDRKPAEAILLFSKEDINLAERIKDLASLQRYKLMLSYAAGIEKCRREYLLSLLNAEPETCFGCDVCTSTVQKEPFGEKEIIRFIIKNKREYTKKEAVRILSGKSNYDIKIKSLKKSNSFGVLSDWSIDEIDDALSSLIILKDIRLLNKGFWKYKLSI